VVDERDVFVHQLAICTHVTGLEGFALGRRDPDDLGALGSLAGGITLVQVGECIVDAGEIEGGRSCHPTFCVDFHHEEDLDLYNRFGKTITNDEEDASQREAITSSRHDLGIDAIGADVGDRSEVRELGFRTDERCAHPGSSVIEH
jgi:hypothetical protein